MRKVLLYILLSLFISLTISESYGAERYIKREISTLDGLSQNDVKSLLQDSYGFIWIATNDGLCRYDGYEFRIFAIGDLGMESILILSITEDKDRNIWIGTADKGLYLYNRSQNRFYHYASLCDNRLPYLHSVRSLCIAPNGDILGYENKTHEMIRVRYDQATNSIQHIKQYKINNNENINITSIVTTPSRIYAGTQNGIYIFDAKSSRFYRVYPKQHISSVTDFTTKGEILFISSRNGFSTLNTRTGKLTKHDFDHNPIHIGFDGSKMWFTTNRGVYVTHYAARRDEFYGTKLVESYFNLTSQALIIDLNGGAWVGFDKEGIIRYEEDNKPFSITRGLGNNNIRSICELEDKTVVGTGGSGLFVLDNFANPQSIKRGLWMNTIYSIAYSEHNDQVYMATNSRVYHTQKDDFSNFKTLTIDSSIRKILTDGEYLWMASYSRGLIRYDLRNHKQIELGLEDNLPSILLRNLMLDSKGNLWICTERGVAMIDASERKTNRPLVNVVLPESEGTHYSISIVESRNGDIWYGTLGHGLFRLQKKSLNEISSSVGDNSTYTVTNFSRRDGLSSNTIKAIVEDEIGNLWISTNRGINQLTINYNTSDETSQINNQLGVIDKGVSVTRYNMYSGLQDYEFNELASAKLADSTILFGGVSGFNYFKPANIKKDTIPAKGVVTDFKIGEHSIYDGGLEGVALSGVQGRDGYVLNHDQNNFSIKFAALHYVNPEMNRYKYRLEGFDREWINSPEGVRVASYSNLAPGHYTFGLRVANSDGIWSDTTLTIPIEITPPFWASWYAYIIYAILLLMIGLSIIIYSHDMMEKRNTIALTNMERQKIREMLEVRTRFFTNVSHEFRTPLTLILSPLQELMADEEIARNKKWRGLLKIMVHNGNSLMRLINEFLSYTKHESGELKINLSNEEFVKLSRSLFEQFKFWSLQRDLKLQFKSSKEQIFLDFDPYLIEQVIYNLVSNAIKHTPAGGVITMSISENESNVILSVRDNGHGVAADKQQHIFKRFYSSASESSKDIGGTGVGLYLSKSIITLHGGEIWFDSSEGEGTTFHFSIPKDTSARDSIAITNNDDTYYVPSMNNSSTKSDDSSNTISALERDSITDGLDGGEHPTLLIIDDNLDILQLLRSLFESHYRVISAENGVDGYKVARCEIPDIIISDVMMPLMDGLELCDKIKNDPATSHIPVILLSAKATQDDMIAGLRISADAYCPKPFNNDMLREIVRTTLSNRRKLALKYSKGTQNEESQIISLREYNNDATTNTDKEFIRRLVRYIEDNIHNPDLVVGDLCREMGVTSLVLNKKLKSLIDMTANTLIRTIKLRRAALLLRTTRYTIADVTYDVGFSDLRYFRECFKKEYGMLPQEYKERTANGVEVTPVKGDNNKINLDIIGQDQENKD